MNAHSAENGRVLDPAALDQLRELQADGEPDVLEELVDMYLSDTAERLGMLRNAVSERRASDVERAAHALAGGSAVFGAEALISVCRQLQTVGREEDLEPAPALLERLDVEYDRLRTALQQEIATDS